MFEPNKIGCGLVNKCSTAPDRQIVYLNTCFVNYFWISGIIYICNGCVIRSQNSEICSQRFIFTTVFSWHMDLYKVSLRWMSLFSVVSMLSNYTVKRNATNNYVNVYCKKVWLIKNNVAKMYVWKLVIKIYVLQNSMHHWASGNFTEWVF